MQLLGSQGIFGLVLFHCSIRCWNYSLQSCDYRRKPSAIAEEQKECEFLQTNTSMQLRRRLHFDGQQQWDIFVPRWCPSQDHEEGHGFMDYTRADEQAVGKHNQFQPPLSPLMPAHKKQGPSQTPVVITAMSARHWQKKNSVWKKNFSLSELLHHNQISNHKF